MDKGEDNPTSLEILFKERSQSIFSKKDDTAKMTKCESKWKVLNFTLDKDAQVTVVLTLFQALEKIS